MPPIVRTLLFLAFGKFTTNLVALLLQLAVLLLQTAVLAQSEVEVGRYLDGLTIFGQVLLLQLLQLLQQLVVPADHLLLVLQQLSTLGLELLNELILLRQQPRLLLPTLTLLSTLQFQLQRNYLFLHFGLEPRYLLQLYLIVFDSALLQVFVLLQFINLVVLLLDLLVEFADSLLQSLHVVLSEHCAVDGHTPLQIGVFVFYEEEGLEFLELGLSQSGLSVDLLEFVAEVDKLTLFLHGLPVSNNQLFPYLAHLPLKLLFDLFDLSLQLADVVALYALVLIQVLHVLLMHRPLRPL
jgi:hypothetical protein